MADANPDFKVAINVRSEQLIQELHDFVGASRKNEKLAQVEETVLIQSWLLQKIASLQLVVEQLTQSLDVQDVELRCQRYVYPVLPEKLPSSLAAERERLGR